MTFNEWIVSLPDKTKSDTLWKIKACRLALFETEIGWRDVTELMKDRRTLGLIDHGSPTTRYSYPRRACPYSAISAAILSEPVPFP